ncbi:MAG: pantoate--beta-alanine ligase, partial [Defluviicoccus sp.]|nr:pantoate--beta-alanine ligase [Defluviicoccus sp.]
MSASGNIEIVRSAEEIRRRVAGWHAEGLSVGLVPTMGAIHEGHLALVRAAAAGSGRAVASLFVNPKQFAPGEDFSAYPRDEAWDARLIAEAGGDLLFAPPGECVYPEGFSTTVTVGGLTDGLCGAFRPGHFEGVATVVAKLFNMVRPDAAWFGEKDFQQLQVIRRLARDLDLGVEVHGVPTVRESDGLALSSRNVYLSADERAAAPTLNRALLALADRAAAPDADIPQAIREAERTIAGAGFGTIDYVAVVDRETLRPAEAPITEEARALAAAWLGK